MLTVINKYLDTAQIKMCNNNWKYIDFNNVTSKTLHLQKLSFMNLTKKQGKLVERFDLEDRKKCADNLKNHLEQFKKDKKTIKGKRCNVYEFVKDALIYSNMEDNKSIVDIINEQWKDNSKQNGLLGNIIPMADTSGSQRRWRQAAGRKRLRQARYSICHGLSKCLLCLLISKKHARLLYPPRWTLALALHAQISQLHSHGL